MSFHLKDYDYNLPPELIAQYPAEPRDSSRLLVLHRESGKLEEKIFTDIVDYLNPGDLLVLNNAKVIPARVYGRKSTGGKIEVLLLEELEKNLWRVLLRPGERVRQKTQIIISEHLKATVIAKEKEGSFRVKFDTGNQELLKLLDKFGKMPLPPYIKRDATDYDKKRYQTVYAQSPGAVAAPTAGLHLTQRLIDRLKEKGVEFAYLTLIVGWGTFKKVSSEDVREHKVDAEYIRVPANTIETIKRCKKRGNKIIAVGTTTVRALESLTDTELSLGGTVSRQTELYIYPPYRFKIVEQLITNFHLPKSSLILLVSAFAGRKRILSTYTYAVKRKFRFYSYGDAMLIT